MQVTHPLADRDASPAAATVGSSTYTVDDDGVVECPDERGGDVADALAEAYGVDPDALIREEGGPPDGVTLDEVEDIADNVIADRIDEGTCPWCDGYQGDAVGQHAASVHPDAWNDYKEN